MVLWRERKKGRGGEAKIQDALQKEDVRTTLKQAATALI